MTKMTHHKQKPREHEVATCYVPTASSRVTSHTCAHPPCWPSSHCMPASRPPALRTYTQASTPRLCTYAPRAPTLCPRMCVSSQPRNTTRTCAYLPHTTLPPGVTRPSSLTLTSMTVPLVTTPSCVYICGVARQGSKSTA